MKKYLFLAVSAIVAVVMTSCDFFTKPTTYEDMDLIGTWATQSQNDEAPDSLWVMVFLPTQSTGTYSGRKGYEYDEGDDVHEEDVLADEDGNGWFIWSINGSTIKTINEMTISSAVEEYDYTIVSLNDTAMTLKHNSYTWNFKRID